MVDSVQLSKLNLYIKFITVNTTYDVDQSRQARQADSRR